MNPLCQVNNNSTHKPIPLRIGFHLLLVLFFLIETILFLTIELPRFSTFTITLDSPLMSFIELDGNNKEDFPSQYCFSNTGNWFLPKKRPLPFIPHREENKYPLKPKKRPKIAIIIDDLGFVRQPTEDFWELKIPLTFSILPWGKYSQLHAVQALENNQQVMLHLPLEPIDASINPGPGAILGTYSSEEALEQLHLNFETIPGIIGVNNHMGSKGTQDPELMRLILKEVKNRGLFFIDSMTINSSIANKIAEKLRVPVANRDVFLDGEGVEGIRLQINRLIEIALIQGSAIGIAHSRPGVAKELAKCLPLCEKAGVELVYVSELVK